MLRRDTEIGQMSLNNDRATVLRIQKDISDLQRKQAEEMKKAATANKNMSSALASAARSNPSIAKNYKSIADREAKNLDSAQEKAANFSSSIAQKMSDLSRAQERVMKGEDLERKDQAANHERQRRASVDSFKKLQEANISLSKDIASLESQLMAAIKTQVEGTLPFVVENAEDGDAPYDFFVSHAWKDKEDFVDGLINSAKSAGLNVWYDKAEMVWGDSIRQKIDDGLRRSYFGVVVLSPNFFERPWTQYELDGIVQRDLTGAGRLLPIWHRLTQDDVAKYAPSLAGRLALPTSIYSTSQIVEELSTVRDRFKAVAK